MRAIGICCLLFSLPAIASQQQMPLEIQQFSGCYADRGIFKMLDKLPGQQQQQNLVLEAEKSLNCFFQEDVFARKAGGKADELLQIKQSAGEYSPQADSSASGQAYIDYCSLATFPFSIETTGKYHFWFRVWVPVSGNWNFDLLINETRFNVSLSGRIPAAGQWFWLQGPACELSAGSHQLQIINLLNGKRLDQILLTLQENFIPGPDAPLPPTKETHIDRASVTFKPLNPMGVLQWQKFSFRNTGGGRVIFAVSTDGGSHFESLSDNDLSRFAHDKPVTLRMELFRQDGSAPEINNLLIDYQLNDQDYLRLQNPGLELLFARQNGALAGIRNPKTGSRYQPAIAGENMFELLVKAPGRKERRYLNFSDAQLLSCHATDNRMDLHWTFPAEAIDVSFQLEALNDWIDWQVTVQNRNAELDVLQVEAPRISRLKVSSNPEDDTLVWPFSAGEFLPFPASRGTQSVSYPDHAGLPYLSLFNRNEGFYFALHDTRLLSSNFFARGNYEQNALELSITRKHRIAPGTRLTSHFALAGHSGDWHRSADLYRRFFYRHYPVNPYRPWLRHTDAWLAGSNTGHSGLMLKHRDYLAMQLDFQYAAFLSLPYIQSWGSTFNGACPTYYLPRADKGGAGQFAEMTRFWRQYGQIGFYFHGNAVSPYYLLTDRYFTVPWKQYPPEFHPPSWDWFKQNREYSSPEQTLPEEQLRQHTARLNAAHAAGEIIRGNAEESLTGYLPMSWHSNAFPDFLRFWLTLYVRQYHCNTAYLDTFAFSNHQPDYNPHLGLHGEGDKASLKMAWLNDWFEQMQQIEPEFCALTEGVADVFGTRLYFLLSGFARNPEIFRYTLPDQIFFQGTCNGLWSKALAEKSLTQAFLLGNRLDLSVIFSHGYHTLRLRQRISPFLNLAVFKDQSGLSCDVPGIEAYVHQTHPGERDLIEHAGSKAVTITFSNRSGKPGRIRYELPPDFTFDRAFLAALYEAPRPWPCQVTGRTLEFDVPETGLGALMLIDSVRGEHAWTAMLEQTGPDRFTVNLFNFRSADTEFSIESEDQQHKITVAAGQNRIYEIIRPDASADFAVLPVTIRSPDFSRTLIISQGKNNRSIPRPEFSALPPAPSESRQPRPVQTGETVLDMDFEAEEFDPERTFSGKRSFRLAGNGEYLHHKIPLTLEPSASYRISLAICKGFEVSKTGYHNSIVVANYSRDKKQTNYITLGGQIPGDLKWHLLDGTFSTGPEVFNTGVYIYNRNSKDPVWIDQLRIIKIQNSNTAVP